MRTCDQASEQGGAGSEPAVISARPPWRSSHRPTGTATAAAARTEAVSAPVTAVGGGVQVGGDRAQQDGEGVVEDAVADGLGDRERGDDPPAVARSAADRPVGGHRVR